MRDVAALALARKRALRRRRYARRKRGVAKLCTSLAACASLALALAFLVESLPAVARAEAPASPTQAFAPNVLWSYNKDLDTWVALDAQKTEETLRRFPSAIMARDRGVVSKDTDAYGVSQMFGSFAGVLGGGNNPGSELFESESAPQTPQASPWVEPEMGTYLLSTIGKTSVFAVALTRQVVFERYFNHAKWVYVRHKIMFPPGSTLRLS